MAAAFENVRPAEHASHPATAARIIAIKSRLADLWPPMMIAIGVVLTFIWAGGLLWLLTGSLLALI